MATQDTLWLDIKDKAQSPDPLDRLASLARGVFYFELALYALGIERRSREGITALFRRSGLKNEPDFPENVQQAIDVRNEAIHEGKIPDFDKCEPLVEALYKAWRHARRKFVTPDRAALLAREILRSDTFECVFLFGSLARNVSSPGDIDLLVFDNGDVSFIDDRYREQRSLKSRVVLQTAGIDDRSWVAAVDSNWVDIVVVHGRLFCSDVNYIRKLANAQNPLFLLNISEGIKHYDRQSHQWRICDTLPFRKWATIREELVREGILNFQR